jgi:hypothetical protein
VRQRGSTPSAEEHNEIKFPELLTPQGEAKGLDTIGKRAPLKSREEELPNA